MEISHYHCSAEWHFAHLSGRGRFFAATLYSFAFHLSKKTGRFWASIPRMAEYFGVTERTVRHALRHLEKTGFLEVVAKSVGQSVQYRPVGHKEWKVKNGAHCITKGTEVPYTNEPQDVLGRQLYAISAQRFKPYPNFVKGMRRIGMADELIVQHFKNFLTTYTPKNKRAWAQGLCGQFMHYLWGQHMPTLRARLVAREKAGLVGVG
jgi:hypothetical protein